MLPQRIGRYDVSAELGRGATSIVYRGVDPADGRVVAIKTLKRTGDEDEAEADAILLRFRHEARVIGRLRHPGVVAVDEFGEDGLHSWIAMEYVDGSSLDDLLLRSPLLGQARVLALMDELLDALGAVHRQGICHRDLKPANIMVTSAGRVKLMDFGVARLRDLGLTRVSAIIGTPAFMAPEQFKGGELDHRADLFACGVLLFLLLAGRRPFSGPPAAVMHQILNEEAPLLSTASGGLAGPAFDAVIARALAKRAADRFASAEEMRGALRDAASLAAETPAGTVVQTVVRDCERDAPAPSATSGDRARFERALAQSGAASAPVVMREGHGHAALVDAFSLYAPDGARGATPADDGDADATIAASLGPALPAAMCSSVQHLLARRLGPVAGVLVKRAADAAGGSRPAFIRNLLAELPDPHRTALRAELEGLLVPPQRTELGR